MSVSPPRRIIRNSPQERKYEEKREKKVKKLSEKLNNQSTRSIEVSTNNKRVEYFPHSDDENPKEKKVANKIIQKKN
jgi:hypothetical protein